MKNFLIRIFIFCFIISFGLFANIEFTNFILRKSGIFELSKNVDTIVLGDSHTECSLNDTIISGIKNLSQSADFYLYSFAKLRELKKNNPNLKNVILAYSYDSLTKYHDENIFNEKYVRYKFGNYYYLMNFSEVFKIIKSNPNVTIPQMFTYMKKSSKLFFRIIFSDIEITNLEVGGYLYLKRDKLQEHLQRTKDNNQIEVNEYSKIQIEYLIKIYNFCLENKINLVLFNAPLYKYQNLYHINQIEYFNFFLRSNLPEATFVNLEDFELPDSAFADCTHLNYKGAKIISNYFEKNKYKIIP